MSPSVLVLGAGLAGLAAAWSAHRRGQRVTVISTGAGASALQSGAVDDVPWERLLRATRLLGEEGHAPPLAPEVLAFARDLGLWDVPEAAPVWLATQAGRVRPARGRDRGLLDLSALAGKTVLLPRVERATWDADALAATFAADPFVRAHRLGLAVVDAAVLRFDEERRISELDLAARHDDEARRGWLADRLREALAACPDAGAILLGPWLGAAAPQADDLSRRVGLPVGEALAGVGGAAGMRFEAARDRLLARLGVARVRARISAVRRGDKGMEVVARGEVHAADRVVLAIGGLAGGGVVYAPPEHRAGADLPPAGGVPFALSLDAPVELSLGAGRLGVVASMHGPELDVDAWPRGGRAGALETVGVRCEGTRAGQGIDAAGDVVAGKARTALAAVASGIAAGGG